MARSRLAPLGVAMVLAAGACGRADSAADWAREAIRPAAIHAHVAFLADDRLEGRGTGQPGYELAASYVAAQFEALGLAPAGDNGSFYQAVRLREAEPDSARTRALLIVNGRAWQLTPGRDFIATPDLNRTETAYRAPIVFAGYGVTAPAFRHDDYAGIDARGKVVATLSGAPASFPPNPRAHYSGTTKAEAAAAAGAVAVIGLWTEESERLYPWAVVEKFSRRPRMTWLDANDNTPTGALGLQSGLLLSPATSAALFEGSGVTLAEAARAAAAGSGGSRLLAAEIEFQAASRHREVTVPNVIGVLRGSDPALRDEYVVYTAHLDHDGIGAPVAGDSIYNGAYDNAAGVAALLEIARAFTTMPAPPRRSILFIATAAEEKGLLGAEHFAALPTVPIGSIVADLNMDGNLMLFAPSSIVAMGSEQSSLGTVARDAATAMGLQLETDLMPEQAFFIRSDQYPFVKKGIPSLFFTIGTQSADSSVNAQEVLGRWLTTVYHTPKDDLDQPMVLEAGAVYARVAFLVGRRVADETARPTWNAGDFFGQLFGGVPPDSAPAPADSSAAPPP